jgi:membrane peptidoglycan carboxypeptidase
VVDRGTGGRLRWFFNFSGEMGGKTGTTQNQSDGWYMGITPKLTAGVWVGAEDRSVHFDNLSQGSGGYMALPIYGYFFQKVYADSTLNVKQEDLFTAPPDFNVNLNCPDYPGDNTYQNSVITYDRCGRILISRNSRDKRSCVFLYRIIKNLLRISRLFNNPCTHHKHPVRHIFHHRKIM